MSRLNLSEVEACGDTLEELIPNYYENKQELDSYEKICSAANAKIKELMLQAGEDTYTVDDYTAKRIVIEKESMNEEKLLAVLHKHNVTEVIKTREYVDMDALEALLYNNGDAPSDFVADLASCKSSTQVVQLRVSKKKPKKAKKEEE